MRQPFRLFIVGINWLPETFIARKLYGLAEAGFHIDVLVSQTNTEKSKHPNIHLHYIPYPAKRDLFPAFAGLGEAVASLPKWTNVHREAWKVAAGPVASRNAAFLGFASVLPILNAKPDIVHFEWNSAAISYLPFYHLFGCPIVISNRGAQTQIAPHNPRRAGLKEGLAESFRHASAVHCVSNAIRDEALIYGMGPEKAWVICPAVDPDFFTPVAGEKPATETFTIVSTGSVIWRKGYEYALLAIRKLADRVNSVCYKIIGDGPERQRLLYTIDDLNLGEHVQLLGKQTPEQIRVHLQRADAFLLSSLSEGISNAALEAMACGVPVVSTDCGGMKEAIRDGIDGFVVPVRDPEAMAQALSRLVDDLDLRRTMGLASRERILEQFTLAQQVEQFKTMYFSLTKPMN